MNKKMFSWIIIVIAGTLLQGCSRPTTPEYAGIDHFRVNSLGADQSDVSADLKYYNPNNFTLKLKTGSVDVYINNRFLGKTILDTLTAIPARDSFLIPVSMKVDMKQVYSNALDILLSKEVNIRLEGFAKMGKGAIYFNLPIKYEGKQKLDISL